MREDLISRARNFLEHTYCCKACLSARELHMVKMGWRCRAEFFPVAFRGQIHQFVRDVLNEAISPGL